MNYRAIVYYVGMVLKLQAVFMLPPLFVALYCGEQMSAQAFLISAAVALLIGLAIDVLKRVDRDIHVKDGFILVAVCWLAISVAGAVPFWLSGEIPSFIDCLFESVSGFTTTGSSIVTDVESLPKALLLWRSLTHWIGGMGVLVFLLAVAPRSGDGQHSVYVMKAESPGPNPGKLVPRLRQSSKILYSIYLGLTVIMFILLVLGGMPVFDSVCNTLATAGTGGFGITNNSIAAYNSLYIEMVIAVFMVLFGVNFNIYFFLLIRNWKGALRNEELRVYIGIVAVSTLLIAWNLSVQVYQEGFIHALRYAFFQVSSVMTTTGFSTANFNVWPEFSKILLVLLMFIGGSAGSTAGGLKVSRVVILVKETRRLLRRMAHPRTVGIVKLDGKAVDKQVVHAVNSYFVTFCLLFCASILVISLDNFDLDTTITSVLACISNVGPGLGLVSPAGNFSEMSILSKLVLSLDMLIGRLEIYPILMMFSPKIWRRL